MRVCHKSNPWDYVFYFSASYCLLLSSAFLQQRMVSLISPPRFTSLHLYFANVVNFALSNHLFSRKTFKKLKKNTI